MGKSGYSCRAKRQRLVVIFFISLLWPFPLYAQTVLRPDLSAKTVNTGSVVTWELLLPDVDDPETVSVSELPRLEGGLLISGPVIRKNYVQKGRQTVREGVRIVCLFRPRETGIKRIRPPQIFAGGNHYTTGEHSIEVHSFFRNQSILPPKIEWEIGVDSVYEGENVPVYLVLKERRSLAIPERITISPFQSGSLEEVKGLSPVRRYSVGDILVFDLPLAAYFFNAQTSGRMMLPQVTVSFDDLGTAVTPPAYLNVKALPESVRNTNAVGDFSFSVLYEKKKLTEGDTVAVSLVLEGSGNFNRLSFPQITTENLIEISRKNEDAWHRDGNRYAGVKRQNYLFMVEKGGQPVVFTVPPLYWYSSVKKQVQKSAPVSVRLKTEALQPESFAVPAGEEFLPNSPETIENYKEWNPFRNPFSLLFFAPGGILFLILPIVLAVRKKRLRRLPPALLLFLLLPLTSAQLASQEEPPKSSVSESGALRPDRLEEAQRAFESGRYEEALRIWKNWEIKTGNIRNAALCYNQAIASAVSKHPSDAVAGIRKAIALNPTHSVYRRFYEKLEKDYQLSYAVAPVMRISVLALFGAVAIGFNLFSLFVFLSAVGKQRIWTVLAALSLTGIFLSGAILILCGYDRLRENVILTESGPLLTIPSSDASSLLDLPEGMVLNVIGETDEFLLVQNSLGITGWIEKAKIREDF